MQAKKHSKAVAGLPAFVIERNTRAVNAGLVIAKQRLNRWQLSTAYEGEPEAFIRAGFVEKVDEFRKAVAAPTKHLGSAYYYMAHSFNPICEYLGKGLYRAEAGKLRMTITREPIPRRSWKIGRHVHAYEVFDSKNGLFNHYVARDVDDLRDAGVLPENADRRFSAYPDSPGMWNDIRGRYDFEAHRWADDPPHYWVWSIRHDEREGVWRLGVSPEGMRKAEKEDRLEAKSNYKSPDEYRKLLEKFINTSGRMLNAWAFVDTRYGKRYELDKASFGRLQLMYSEAENIIAGATIHVSRDPDLVAEDEARERAQRELHAKLTEAGQDVNLQDFLAKVVPLSSRRSQGNAQ